MILSDRYRKVLVTVSMGFRSINDVRKNGLYIFREDTKDELISYIKELFSVNKSVLALKIKEKGFHSEHVLINSLDELNKFINSLNDIFKNNCEVWIVSSSVIDCFRCRIYLSLDEDNDYIEMAYSCDDHILDHISTNSDCKYICFKKDTGNYRIMRTNMDSDMINDCRLIIKDIMSKYSDNFKKIREDLNIIGINGISLDVRVNNGYDFHDFDVVYGDVEKVIDYYVLNNYYID